MLKTDRLLLRKWTKDDFLPFAQMGRDKEVMEYFPKLLTQIESDAIAQKIMSLIEQRGWGFWAVEIPEQEQFIGFVGLHIPKPNLPFAPCVEIGWRISKLHWGKGYATEAARASLEYAFNTLNLDEVVSFTTVSNHRSRAVMEKIGMCNTNQNFVHPDVEISNPLCEHVLYKISNLAWRQMPSSS